MVVLNESAGHTGLPHTPLLPGEEARVCEACGRTAIASPFRGRSDFRRSRNWYSLACRSCLLARSGGLPEEQDARIDAWEERELAGEELPTPRQKRSGSPGAGPVIEMEPFRAWVRERLEGLHLFAAGDPSYPAQKILAERLGVESKTIYLWLGGPEDVIEEERVDSALSREGGWMLSDLYGEKVPEGPASAPEEPRGASGEETPPARRCASQGCPERASEGRFCAEHAARLAAIRAGLEADGREMSAHGGAPLGSNKRRRAPKQPTCCRSGCWEPRRPGETFCIECQAMGYEEGEE